MKIAIPTADGRLCMHFGHCQQFALVDVDQENGNATQTELVTPPPHEPGLLPRWLHEKGVDLIIAGGMGQRAQQLFTQSGVEVVVGARQNRQSSLFPRISTGIFSQERMLVTIDMQAEAPTYSRLRKANHPGCFACSTAGKAGLALEFVVERPGCVEATFDCAKRLQGYNGVLHGGVICLLLDAAMTNCGFSMGRAMVTGDMKVRFLHPVPTDNIIQLRAWAEASSDLLQSILAEVTLNDRVMARAVGRFVDKSFSKIPSG